MYFMVVFLRPGLFVSRPALLITQTALGYKDYFEQVAIRPGLVDCSAMDRDHGELPRSGTMPDPTPRKCRVRGTDQAHRLQAFAYDAAMALRLACTDSQTGLVACDKDTAGAIHKLIQAWDCAADRLRVLKGKGLPASVRSKQVKTAQVQPLEPA